MDDKPEHSPIFYAIAILAVLEALALVAYLSRPCELYRIRVTWRYEQLDFTTTVCGPFRDGRCMCRSFEPIDNPWTVMEGSGPMQPAQISDSKVIPRVTF